MKLKLSFLYYANQTFSLSVIFIEDEGADEEVVTHLVSVDLSRPVYQ